MLMLIYLYLSMFRLTSDVIILEHVMLTWPRATPQCFVFGALFLASACIHLHRVVLHHIRPPTGLGEQSFTFQVTMGGKLKKQLDWTLTLLFSIVRMEWQ